MRDADTGDDGRIAEEGGRVREVVEESYSPAKQHGREIDVNRIEQPGVQALLNRLSAVYSHRLRGGGRFRPGDGAFDAVGHELDRRAGPRPPVGHLMGDDERRDTPRVLAVPAVRRDAARISIEFSVSLLREDSGELIGIGAVMRDNPSCQR